MAVLQQTYSGSNIGYGGGIFTHTSGSRMGVISIFRASSNYSLSEVEFDIERNGSMTGDLQLTIYNASSGTTLTTYIGDGSTLAYNSVPSPGGFTKFTFSTPIALTANNYYAVGLKWLGSGTSFPVGIYYNRYTLAGYNSGYWDGSGNTSTDWVGWNTSVSAVIKLYSPDATGWAKKLNNITPVKINGIAVTGITKVNGI